MNTNTEREELAKLISSRHTMAAVDAILAAGYRKARTITTTEGLDALPNGSAVLDGSGDVGQKLSGLWHFPETAPIKSSKVAKYGAATVLYTPEPTR